MQFKQLQCARQNFWVFDHDFFPVIFFVRVGLVLTVWLQYLSQTSFKSKDQIWLYISVTENYLWRVKLKCYVKPIKDPLGIGPSKGNQGTTRGKEKILLTSVGIEPTTSGLALPLLCQLSYEVRQKVGDDIGG